MSNDNQNIENQSGGEEVSLEHKIAALPVKPGIYQFKNSNDNIIYVGKAKSLRSRVRQYFQKHRPADAKTNAMIGHIADVEVIVVDSEAEALILEDTLIKKYKPKYNVLLRDDKSYPYVRVTNEEYPRIFITRKMVRDGSKYFGPFTEVKPLKRMMRLLRTLFYIRSCDYNLTDETIRDGKYKICLDYHIEKCEGPCEGFVSREHYNQNIKNAIKVLTGKTKELEKQFQEQMYKLSEDMKFEEAAIVRNKLQMLHDYTSNQKIVAADPVDRDVFALARVEDSACTIIFKIREGKLIGKRHFIIKDAENETDEEMIRRTVEKWYIESEFVPKEIFLPVEPDDLEYLLDWLGKKRGKSINIHIPKIGEKKKLVNMAAANAEFILREFHIAIAKREQVIPRMVVSLQRDLRLKQPPRVIECIDNSHIQGSDFVSSLVVFEDGKPKKSEYRKFKIKTVEKSDDFAAMRETVQRRYTRLLNEDKDLPDLIIVDGGKGQLSSAVQVLKELGIFEEVNIIGLAKRLEEVFFPGQSEAVMLPKTSSSLRLIQQLRDEAHRFAITFHRDLRTKRTIRTELTDIPGIGVKTANKLLKEFKSIENLRKADDEKLKEHINSKQLKELRKFLSEAKLETEKKD